MSNETLTITDNRTGQKYELAITDNTIRANDLQQIAADLGVSLAKVKTDILRGRVALAKLLQESGHGS